MNVTITYKYLLGALLLSAAVSSFSVALGPLRGATILGRPFDATVIAQMNDTEKLPALCVESDIFFGKSQVAPNRIQTTVSAGLNPGEALIKIQATALIDEPVVTVSLSEGCLQKNTRKYVVLAEVPSASKSLSSQPWVGAAGVSAASLSSGLAQSALGLAGSVGDAAETGNSAKGLKAARSSRSAAVQPAAGTASRAVESSKAALYRPKRLSVALPIERDPALRSSMELLSTPTSDLQKRANAAALWQAVSVQPEDVLRNNERLKALEVDLPNVPAERRKTDLVVEQLKGELDQVRGERYSNWLVYLLGAVVFLLLLLGIFSRTGGGTDARKKTAGASR